MSTTEETFPAHIRRRRVAEMLLGGVTSQNQMAAALGTSEALIRNDIKAIRKQWCREEPKKLQERIATRVKQLEMIYGLAYNDFRRSQEPRHEVITRPCENGKCRHGLISMPDGSNEECHVCDGNGFIKTIKVTTQTGNVAYLQAMRDCIIECARLEGIHPSTVTKLKQTARELLPDGTVRERIEELYTEAPFELIIEGLSQIDAVKEKMARGKLVLEAESSSGQENGIESAG